MKCEEENCNNKAIKCYLPDIDSGKDIISWYCPEHAHQNGYCCCCGEFWGGVEIFEFNPSGLCPNCQDEIDTDFAEDLEDEYYEVP